MSLTKTEELQHIHHGIERCRKCRLYKNRRHAVPGEGDVSSRIMLIGEAPGEQEDINGRPFCGRAGKFLDEVLQIAGLSRRRLFITSCVKCRPPDNREPRDDEPATCIANWLKPQIELIQPAIVVLLGKVAVKNLSGMKGSMKELHGKTIDKDGRCYFLTYHPAAGMRFPEIRETMKNDFDALVGLKQKIIKS